MPADAAERYRRFPLTATLLRLSGDTAAFSPAPGPESRLAGTLWSIVEPARPNCSAYVATLPADRIASDERRDLYRLR